LLAWHSAGFPIDSIDRFASTSSSPLQLFNAATQPHPIQSLARHIRAMLHHEPLLDRSNHRLQRLKLRRQLDQIRTSVYRRAFISFVCNNRQRLLESLACLRGYNPNPCAGAW
jgi:hypothetical protein